MQYARASTTLSTSSGRRWSLRSVSRTVRGHVGVMRTASDETWREWKERVGAARAEPEHAADAL